MALKCLGHGSKTLVGVEDLLVAKEYTVRIFHCGGRVMVGFQSNIKMIINEELILGTG